MPLSAVRAETKRGAAGPVYPFLYPLFLTLRSTLSMIAPTNAATTRRLSTTSCAWAIRRAGGGWTGWRGRSITAANGGHFFLFLVE